MDYTSDWFSMKIPHLKEIIKIHKNGPWNCLEIGSWEGRSACFLMEELPDSRLTCIDTFKGSIEHVNEDTENVYKRFMKNTEPYKDRITVIQSDSFSALKKLEDRYDYIFIDGSHEYNDVVYDALLAWKLVKPGGVFIFDDFGVFPGVNKAITVFESLFASEIQQVYNAYDQRIYIVSNTIKGST